MVRMHVSRLVGLHTDDDWGYWVELDKMGKDPQRNSGSVILPYYIGPVSIYPPPPPCLVARDRSLTGPFLLFRISFTTPLW